MNFPAVCPDIPVFDLPAALAYYRDRLGFKIDWSDEGLGLGCISRGQSRIFVSNAAFREPLGVKGPMLLWLNLDGRAEVDALYAEWAAAGAKVAEPPEDHAYNKLHEFFAEDLDGNHFRVFYDYGGEEQAEPTA